MSKKTISRRVFLKGVGAVTAGVATVHFLGPGVRAFGDPSGEAISGSSGTGKFVYKPFWGEDNIKTPVGGEILFFGDIHDLEDDYFYYDPASGESRGVFSYLVKEKKYPGLYACIGDYLQSSSDITEGADVYRRCTERIRAWSGEGAPIVSVMGNHENKTAGMEELDGAQVFEKHVGNNNYGLIARGVDEAEPEKTLYYVVALGCAHTQEIDEANTRANAKNKYWVNPDAIDSLDRTLESIYGEDGSRNQGVPTFITAHLPVHYYTSERSAENSCDLLTVLNKYPYVVYIWGHNHSEKDPGYGSIRLPGDTIVPNASLSDKKADGEPAAQEICFTYISCGAVRGNQISDNELEDSERALYVSVDGSKLHFEYCGRDGNVFDRTAYADLKDETYFEDFRTRPAKSAAGLTVDLAEETDMSVVRRGNFFLNRPVAGELPGEVISFSERYTTTGQWLDSNGEPVSGEFQNGASYTLRLTLSGNRAVFALGGEDVYLFDMSAVAIPERYIERRFVSVDSGGCEAVIDIEFIPTAAVAEQPVSAAEELSGECRYVITSDTEQYLFTCSRADCASKEGKLLTVPNPDGYWMFEDLGDGFAMRSASGKYLTVSINGPHVVLTPVKDLSAGEYTKWNFREGMLSIYVGSVEYFFSYAAGEFSLLTGTGSACRLYALA